MNKKIISLAILLILVTTASFGQIRKRMDRWYRHKHTLTIATGGNIFLGDLGGGSGEGTTGFKDVNTEALSYAFTVSYKYKLGQRWNLRGSLSYAQVTGADSLSDNKGRKNRNLSFRSPIIEFTPMAEFYILPERFSATKRWGTWVGRNKPMVNLSWYVATGISMFYFNPQAEANGTWYNLQPLNTEGQGLNGEDPYSRVSFAIPVISGFQFMFNQKWSFGFEAGIRYTFTDYIDDVSGNYYDNETLQAVNGEESAYFADRNLSGNKREVGTKRGNSDNNDVYIFGQITISRKLFLKR
tara:strand:- start:662 stop:1555 length:894 start_codon:yes stop_codon:yes gene_type:complete